MLACPMIHLIRSLPLPVLKRPSRLILDERLDVVPFQLLTSRQKFQLNDEHQSIDSSAQALNQIADRLGGAAGGKQIVRYDHALTVAYCITMNLKRVLAIFEIVRNRRAFRRQLLRFPDGKEPSPKVISERGRKDKSARLDANHRVNLGAFVLSGQRVDGTLTIVTVEPV